MLDQKWLTNYILDFEHEWTKWQDKIEEVTGHRPEVEFIYEPSIKIQAVYKKSKDVSWTLYGSTVNIKNSQKGRKPHLMAKEYARRVVSLFQNSHHIAALWARSHAYNVDFGYGPNATPWQKVYYDKPEMKHPPTTLEKILWPSRAKSLTKAIAEFKIRHPEAQIQTSTI